MQQELQVLVGPCNRTNVQCLVQLALRRFKQELLVELRVGLSPLLASAATKHEAHQVVPNPLPEAKELIPDHIRVQFRDLELFLLGISVTQAQSVNFIKELHLWCRIIASAKPQRPHR